MKKHILPLLCFILSWLPSLSSAQTFGDPFEQHKPKLWIFEIKEPQPNQFEFVLLDSSATFPQWTVPEFRFSADSQTLLYANVKKGTEEGTFMNAGFIQFHLKNRTRSILPTDSLSYEMPVSYQDGFTITERHGIKTDIFRHDPKKPNQRKSKLAQIPMNLGEYLWLNENELIFTDLLPDINIKRKLYRYNIRSKKMMLLAEAFWISHLQKVPNSDEVSFMFRPQPQNSSNQLQIIHITTQEKRTPLKTPGQEAIWDADGKRLWTAGGLSNLYILQDKAVEWAKVSSLQSFKISQINRMEISANRQYVAVVGEEGAIPDYPIMINESLSVFPLENVLPPARLDSLATLYMPMIEAEAGAKFTKKPTFAIEGSGLFAAASYHDEDNSIRFNINNIKDLVREWHLPDDQFMPLVKVLLLHELTHALQFQHIASLQMDSLRAWGNQEKGMILKALIEGHATYIEGKLAPKIGLGKQHEEYRSNVLNRANTPNGMAIKQIYYDGRDFVAYHFNQGGNDKVWSLFDNPPKYFSTIHFPEMYQKEVEKLGLDMKMIMANVLKDWRKDTMLTESYLNTFHHNSKLSFLPEDQRILAAASIRQAYSKVTWAVPNSQETKLFESMDVRVYLLDDPFTMEMRAEFFEQWWRTYAAFEDERMFKAAMDVSFETPFSTDLPLFRIAKITPRNGTASLSSSQQHFALSKADLYLELDCTNTNITPEQAEAIFNDIWTRYQAVKK